MAIWDDRRSGLVGCIVGDQVLQNLSREHGTFMRLKGTAFESKDALWIGRFAQQEYLPIPTCHWANVSWDQHLQLEALATAAGKELFYLFITLGTAASCGIDYWQIPGDMIKRYMITRMKDQTRRVFALHIVAVSNRYVLDSEDVTAFHQSQPVGAELKDNPRLYRRRSPLRSRSRAVVGDSVAPETPDSGVASGIGDTHREFSVPLSHGRSAVLNLPSPLDQVDVNRIKGWVDLMTDVLTSAAPIPQSAQSVRDVLNEWTERNVIGAWKGRRDIRDSAEFARELRNRTQVRSRD